MAAEVLAVLFRLNAVASAAMGLVFLLRPFVRRCFGAHTTYALWLAVPLAMGGALMPPAEAFGPLGPAEIAAGRAEAWFAADGRAEAVALAWAAGLLVSAGLLAWRYARFEARARSGRAGPAVVGVFAPRLVTPSDFAVRFTPDERRLVRAHERAHMDRLDARCNALAAVLQCLNWFNPLVHLAAGAMRFDQELACDATVMSRMPAERRRYAETLLRSQETTIASPLGCGWTGGGAGPFVTRLTTLLQPAPGDRRRSAANLLLAALWTAALVGAWMIQPPYRRPGTQDLVPNCILLDLTPPAHAMSLTGR